MNPVRLPTQGPVVAHAVRKPPKRIPYDLRDIFSVDELQRMADRHKVGFLDSAGAVIAEAPASRNWCRTIMGENGCQACPGEAAMIAAKPPSPWITCHAGIQRGLTAIRYNSLTIGWIASPTVHTENFRQFAKTAGNSDLRTYLQTPSYSRSAAENAAHEAMQEIHHGAIERRRERFTLKAVSTIKHARDLSALLDVLFEAVRVLFGPLKAVCFYVERKDLGNPGYYLERNEGADSMVESSVTPLNQGHIGKAINDEKPYYEPRLKRDDPYFRFQRHQPRPRAVLTIPIRWGLDPTRAAIQLQSDQEDFASHGLDREAMYLLVTLAGQVSVKLATQGSLRSAEARARTLDEWTDFVFQTLVERATNEKQILQRKQELFQRFVKKLRVLAGPGCIATNIRLLNPLTQILGFVACDGEDVWTPERMQKLYPLNKGAAHKALKQEQVYYPDVTAFPQEEDYYKLIPETKSLWCMKFAVHYEVVGVISVDWNTKNGCSDEKYRAFRALLGQLERVLEALSDREEILLRALLAPVSITSELQGVAEVLVHSLKDLLSTRACTLFLDRDGEHVLKLCATTDPGEGQKEYSFGPDTPADRWGITGWVARHRKSVRIRDSSDSNELDAIAVLHGVDEELRNARIYVEEIDMANVPHSQRSFLAAPLVAREKVLGVLRLAVKNGPGNEFTHQDETFLQEFANRLARALDTRWVEEDGATRLAALQHETEWRERMRNAPGLPQMGQILCDQFMNQMGAVGAYLHIHDEGNDLEASVASGVLKLLLAAGDAPRKPDKFCFAESVWEDEPWSAFCEDLGLCFSGRAPELIQSAGLLPVGSDREVAALVLCWQARKERNAIKRDLDRLSLQAQDTIQTALKQAADRKKQEGALKAQLTLHRLGLAFSSHRRLEDLCPAILREACEHAGFPEGTIRLYDPVRGWVSYATSGRSEDEVPPVIQTNRSLSRATKTRTPYLVTKDDPDWKQDLKSLGHGARKTYLSGLGCWVAIPLHAAPECLGAILLESGDLLHLGQPQIDFLETLGHLASVAIRSIQLNQKDLAAKPFEMIGAMLGGFLHVMRNKANNAMAHLALVGLSEITEAERALHLRGAEDDLKRIKEVSRKLVGFSRTSDKELVDLTRLFEPAWKDMPDRLRAKVKLDIQGDAGSVVTGNRNQLELAVQMLVQNALEAMPGGGVLSCRTRVRNGRVDLRIADTGRGMDKNTREHCLEPFFTRKTKGTGLGLWVVGTIVRIHRGHLTVKSHEGRRTVFKVQFASPEEVTLG
jgi:GAF domain-containing protein